MEIESFYSYWGSKKLVRTREQNESIISQLG